MAAEVESRDDINGSGIPSVHDFIRRGCHTVAVLGDYLYIDGGQLTERVNGSMPADSPSFDGKFFLFLEMAELPPINTAN